jgi:NADH:ubiquinone oxidoreductase subunit C
MPEWPGSVARAYDDLLHGRASVDLEPSPLTVDVPADGWVEALGLARDTLGCTFFDWLSAVDEGDDGFRVVCHLARHRPGRVDHLLVRVLLPRERPSLRSAGAVFAGAPWHERETHEMFGIEFTAGDGAALAMDPLLLPPGFEGHPLRKDFVLASRAARPWPGVKEPGESGEPEVGGRRRLRPPGAPVPGEWGGSDG